MSPVGLKDMSLKRKIVIIAMVSTSLSLLAACLVLVLNEWITFPKVMERNLSGLARIVGDNSTAALSFNDDKTAREVLATLGSNPHILSAYLYDGKNRLVAQYRSEGEGAVVGPPGVRPSGVWVTPDKVALYHDIRSGQERVGTLYLESDMGEMKARLHGYTLVMLLALAFSVLVSLVVASQLQRRVTEPLMQVVEKLKDIASGEGDLSKRLQVTAKDEIGEVAEAFNTYVEKLQSVDEMKLGLISVVSHQLKTPVAEINGYIENMLEGLTGELTPKQERYLKDMRDIGRDNYKLISDLLSASKIERGVVTVDLKPVSLKQVADQSLRDYEESIKGKGLAFYREGFDREVTVLADRDKTVETLRNVLNNALKCTDKGSITLALGTEGGLGTIEVRDTGIGMGEETLSRLFTKSRVLGKEAGRAGAGLGLYIAKHFMKLQGGDIQVSSRKGAGSTFTLIIPAVAGPEGARL